MLKATKNDKKARTPVVEPIAMANVSTFFLLLVFLLFPQSAHVTVVGQDEKTYFGSDPEEFEDVAPLAELGLGMSSVSAVTVIESSIIIELSRGLITRVCVWALERLER